MKWCLVECLGPFCVSFTLGSLSTIFLFAWRIVLAKMVGIRSMPLPAGIFRSDE